VFENLIIVSGLSGAGKTTLVEHALSVFQNATKAITCTTRKKRVGEQDGVHYRFFTRRQFTLRKEFGQFAESKSNVYGHMYGTRKEDIDDACKTHSPVFLIVDIQGVKTLSRLYPKARKIFITAEIQELEMRLADRHASPKDITKRVATAKRENLQMLQGRFDFIIENSNGELTAIKKLFCIVVQNMIDDITRFAP
jgi:guanylate kinase